MLVASAFDFEDVCSELFSLEEADWELASDAFLLAFSSNEIWGKHLRSAFFRYKHVTCLQ